MLRAARAGYRGALGAPHAPWARRGRRRMLGGDRGKAVEFPIRCARQPRGFLAILAASSSSTSTTISLPRQNFVQRLKLCGLEVDSKLRSYRQLWCLWVPHLPYRALWDGGMLLHLCLRKGQRHPFLPREVPFGIGSVVLARVFCLVGHIGAEVGHDLRGKQLHGPHDLLVRDLAQA